MHVSRICDVDQWQALAAEWEKLSPCRPLLSPAWLLPWWRHYGQRKAARELFVLAVHDHQGQLVGLAPWYLERARYRGATIRFLGSGEVCSDDMTILCRPGDRQAVCRAIADWMLCDDPEARTAASRCERWNLLDLSGIDAEDPTVACFLAACRHRSAIVHRRVSHNCWTIELPDSWPKYLGRLSKSHRKRIRRLERRYFDSGRVRPWEAVDRPTLERGFAILTQLHAKRWRAQGEPGVFASPRFAAFHSDVARAMLDRGQLRLGWLELDGQPIAAEYQVASRDTIYAYQSGMDPAQAEHQPGNLSMIATIRRAIERGVANIDLMRGDEPYKAHWRARSRPAVALRILPPQSVNRLRQQIWQVGQSGKAWARTVTRRTTPAPLPAAQRRP